MNTTRRKLAIATWAAPREGTIHGKLTIDATEALAYLDALRRAGAGKVTLTHLVGKAVGLALAQAPSLNGYLRLGRYLPHGRVDLAFLVALEGGNDLAKVKVCDVDEKSVSAIARELGERAERLRRGEDDEFKKSKGPLRVLPVWLLRPLLWTTGFVTSSLGIAVPAFGLEAFPFGSCILTSVGMFGLDEGYVPFTPFARVPLYVLVGAVAERPWVVDGRIVPRPLLTVTATIDHRFMDGAQGGVLARVVRETLEDPWRLGEVERPPDGGRIAAAGPR